MSYKEITHIAPLQKIRVVPQLAELLSKSKLYGVQMPAQHDVFKGFAYYDVNVKIGKEIYFARLNVGIRENGDSTLYEIKPFTKIK